MARSERTAAEYRSAMARTASAYSPRATSASRTASAFPTPVFTPSPYY
jgi:hypothetical protein